MVKVTILHLDLGIGGAERLIVDAAVALKKNNHDVEVITTHHDRSHCFTETVDGTLPVTVVGDWLPRNIFGKFAAVFSYLRMMYAALYLIFFSGIKTDVVLCDQVSACIPILKLKIDRILFYCHFPDMLCSGEKGSRLKQLYRIPINFIEEQTTGLANTVLVNSGFTRDTFKKTFTTLSIIPEILYPSINDGHIEDVYNNCDDALNEINLDAYRYFLSINRYERKKNIMLALDAFKLLLREVDDEVRDSLKLIVAGGYDHLVEENEICYVELQERAKSLTITNQVIFLKSPSESEKIKLIKYCEAVIYTPSNEHFGIVPLEAMFCKKPVIAVNNGGPTETVIHNETGLLCEPTKEAFAAALYKLITEPKLVTDFGDAAKIRFEENFSFNAFCKKLNMFVDKCK